MENASKALIIAGAILLSILLISLGIMVYQNARNATDDTGLDAEKVQTFNTRITQYCGSNKTAANMNALIDAISASNGAQSKLNDQHVISVNAGGVKGTGYVTGDCNVAGKDAVAESASVSYPRFSPGCTYEASYKTDRQGYVNEVIIKNNITN